LANYTTSVQRRHDLDIEDHGFGVGKKRMNCRCCFEKWIKQKAKFEAKYGAVLGAIIGAVAVYLIIVMTQSVRDVSAIIALMIAGAAFEAVFIGGASYLLIRRKGLAKMRLRLVEFLHHSHVGSG
jgi:ABC-type Fe3+-siderophore transport system permease subunit